MQIPKSLRSQTNKAEKEIGLDRYLGRMSEIQESIYYRAGESMEA